MYFGAGQSLTRKEDERLLTGHGQYSDDFALEHDQCKKGYMLRSPYGHAKITAIDISSALEMPGVQTILTAQNFKDEGWQSIPCNYALVNSDGRPLDRPPHPILADGFVRHVGDPIAFIVAGKIEQARDAAEAIEIDYEALPAIADMDQAITNDSPQIWPEHVKNNTAFQWDIGSSEETSTAMQKAKHRIQLRLVNNRIVVAPMENRCAVGLYQDDRYMLHTPSQGVHSLHKQLTTQIMNIPAEKLRVLSDDVGGGFGMKIFCYAEQPCVLLAAKLSGYPVHWSGDRSSDSFLSDSQGRDNISYVEIGLDDSYRFLALKVKTLANMGAYLSNFAPFIPTECCAHMLTGVYDIPHIYNEVLGVYTNTVPVDAYRGAGRPEMTYLVERLINYTAAQLNISALELRERNFIKPEQLPFETVFKTVYKDSNFPEMHKNALLRADVANFDKRKEESEKKGFLRGLGTAYFIEKCGGGAADRAELRLRSDGDFDLLVGTHSNGQGHETAYAQIAASHMGIDYCRINVVQGDTDKIETGKGTGGSRSTPITGSSTLLASQTMVKKGLEQAAAIFEASSDDIAYSNGEFFIKGTDRKIDWQALAQKHQIQTDTLLSAHDDFGPAEPTYPNGCHICEVEIDKGTGQVRIDRYLAFDDFGTILNPMLLLGQIHGGLTQGIGQALMENAFYDADGQFLTGSFMDYCMPRADSIPLFDIELCDDYPCSANPLGVKGAGEAGAVAAPPTVINAVVDALKDYGLDHIDMPVNSEKIFSILNK